MPLWLRLYIGLFLGFGSFLVIVSLLRLLGDGPSALAILDASVGCMGIAAGLLTVAIGHSRLIFVAALIGFLVSFASQMISEDGLTLLNAAGTAVWAYAVYDAAFVRVATPLAGGPCPPQT